jgi:glycosyltransferase involved in cell wall biosynthesis
MRIAVITAFHAEPEDWLQQMGRSVRRQTWPHVQHILVGDAPKVRVQADQRSWVLELPSGCRDFGDTPRALGALYAAGLGFDAVAFLDADNWYRPDHLEQLVKLHQETGAPVLSSRRAFHRLDGSYMAECAASDGEVFADTNTLMLTRPAFRLLSEWALMPRTWHGVGDRVFWHAIKKSGMATAHCPEATVAYRTQHAGIYRDLGEAAPPGAVQTNAVALAARTWQQAAPTAWTKVQWRYRRRLTPEQVLPIYALTIREQGAVNLTRIGRPLQSLADTGQALTKVGTQLSLPMQGPPGVLILHRHFLADAAMRSSLDRLADRGWVLIADIDDDPHHWAGYVDTAMVAFKAVHAVTVSTPALEQMIRAWNPLVKVFPNMVDDLPAAVMDKRGTLLAEAAASTPSTPPGKIKVFFGAFNRLKDAQVLLDGFSLVPPELREQIDWVVLHDRGFHDAIPEGYGREFHATCPWDRYMELLAECDCAALPLQDNHFNRFKSDLKLVEALACGAVPICSRVVYGNDHDHGAPYLRWASTPQEWATQLTELITDRAGALKSRLAGYTYVNGSRLQWQQNEARVRFYKSLLAQQASLERERQERMRRWRSREISAQA